MTQRPYVICHMISSIDGGLHPSKYTASPDGSVKDWTGITEGIHDTFGGDAWMIGRVTMAEMAKGEPHPPAEAGTVERPCHFACRDAEHYAIAVYTSGALHFREPEIGGDHVVVLLGDGVDDRHLAELRDDGISYIVSDGETVDLAAALALLRSELGIERVLLEGGAMINGSLLAAGLVDELSVVIAPALDARTDPEAIIAFEGGLAGKLRLAFKACTPLEHGMVHLRYDVLPADA